MPCAPAWATSTNALWKKQLKGWRLWICTFPTTSLILHCTMPMILNQRTNFGSALAVCWSCCAPDQVVPCLCIATKGNSPISNGWRAHGLAVAKPYVALTMAWSSWATPPLNSVWGRCRCTAGATRTQTHTLLHMLMLLMLDLRLAMVIY